MIRSVSRFVRGAVTVQNVYITILLDNEIPIIFCQFCQQLLKVEQQTIFISAGRPVKPNDNQLGLVSLFKGFFGGIGRSVWSKRKHIFQKYCHSSTLSEGTVEMICQMAILN